LENNGDCVSGEPADSNGFQWKWVWEHTVSVGQREPVVSSGPWLAGSDIHCRTMPISRLVSAAYITARGCVCHGSDPTVPALFGLIRRLAIGAAHQCVVWMLQKYS